MDNEIIKQQLNQEILQIYINNNQPIYTGKLVKSQIEKKQDSIQEKTFPLLGE